MEYKESLCGDNNLYPANVKVRKEFVPFGQSQANPRYSGWNLCGAKRLG